MKIIERKKNIFSFLGWMEIIEGMILGFKIRSLGYLQLVGANLEHNRLGVIADHHPWDTEWEVGK